MDKNAPSDFTRAFHAVIGEAIKKQVPLDFLVVNLEITKIDLANRFINQQAAFKAHNLAQNIADESLQLSKSQQEAIKARALAKKTAEETDRLNKLNN